MFMYEPHILRINIWWIILKISRGDKNEVRQRGPNCTLHTKELFEPRSPLISEIIYLSQSIAKYMLGELIFLSGRVRWLILDFEGKDVRAEAVERLASFVSKRDWRSLSLH